MDMLTLLIIVATLILLQTLIKPLKKKIQNATSIEESNEYRRKAKIIILTIGFLCLLLINIKPWEDGLYGFIDLLTKKPLLTLSYAIVIMVWYWAIAKEVFLGEYQIAKHLKFKDVFLKISTKDIKDIPDKFILYLRGFEQDNYDLAIEIEESANKEHFNESRLCTYLSTCIPIYAVGMNKELWQPNGATRIYVDDEKWMEEVKLLMEKSVFIIILINDRKSCLWEIEQSHSTLDKTIFIVDNLQKYKNAKETIKSIELPNIDLKTHNNGFYFYAKDNHHHEIIPFDPAYESEYDKLSNCIKAKSGIRTRLSKDALLLYIISIILSFIPLVFYTTRLLSSLNPFLVLSICISLMSCISYWMLLKMRKKGYVLLVTSILLFFFSMLKFGHIDSYLSAFDLVIPSMINDFIILISPKYGITSKTFFDTKN